MRLQSRFQSIDHWLFNTISRQSSLINRITFCPTPRLHWSGNFLRIVSNHRRNIPTNLAKNPLCRRFHFPIEKSSRFLDRAGAFAAAERKEVRESSTEQRRAWPFIENGIKVFLYSSSMVSFNRASSLDRFSNLKMLFGSLRFPNPPPLVLLFYFFSL